MRPPNRRDGVHPSLDAANLIPIEPAIAAVTSNSARRFGTPDMRENLLGDRQRSALMKMRVRAIRENGRGNLGLQLVPIENAHAIRFKPGAHIDVRTPSGALRQYSLCNGRDDLNGYHLCVRLEEKSRGGSASLHQNLAVGDLLDVSAPRNPFRLP